ncbi:MAG: VanZ family protein [Lachnospiraceae bacterium]
MTKKQVLLMIAIIVWMGFIFSMSAQNGSESQALSDGVVDKIVRLIGEVVTDEPLSDSLVSQISFLVRKAAHMTEYAILGFLCIWYADDLWGKGIKVKLGCWLFATCYAVTDEFHQLFSDGRSAQIRDVCIDSAGVIIGILAFFCICAILRMIDCNSQR